VGAPAVTHRKSKKRAKKSYFTGRARRAVKHGFSLTGRARRAVKHGFSLTG
jgi:hypothetical protein